MAITDRILAPLRRAFTGRPPSVSLAEGKSPDQAIRGSNSVSYGVSDGSKRLLDLEHRYELRGLQGGRTYRRMRRGDPHIYHLRRAMNLPIIGAAVTIDPSDPKDADALAKKELVERALLNGSVWPSFVRDSLLSQDYGFSCFEICWFRDEATGEDRCRLELRPTSSIQTENIFVRGGAIDHVVQTPIDGPEVELPGDKIVWLSYDKEGDGFNGSPILRPMYQPWQTKLEMILELPIVVRKGGGIPDITTDAEKGTDEWNGLEAAGRNYGVGPESFVMHGENTTFEVISTDVHVKDILEAITLQNQEITAVCQAQVFDLGINKAGSFALGKTLSDAFHNGVQSQADYIASVLNADGGLIHQLVDFNFPSDENRPILRFGNVETIDMKALAQTLLSLSQALGSIPPDVVEWALQQMNMPTGDVAQVVVDAKKKEPPAPAAPQPAGQGEDEAGGSSPESGAKAAEGCDCGETHGLRLAERQHRAPRGAECFVQLAELDARFDDARTAVRVATQATREKLIAELVSGASTAQEKGELGKFVADASPMVDKLTAEVRDVLADFYAAGREQVAGELDRQRRGEPVTPPALEERRSIAAAEKPPRKAIPAALPDPDDAMDELAPAIARSIAGATQSAAALAASQIASGVPLDPAALSQLITRESDGAALRFGANVSSIMQLGRATEANERVSDIAFGQLSAILDENTCEVCEDADGFESEDLSEVAALAPNPGCHGGIEKCRCFDVYVLRSEPLEEAA